jgi:predicted lipoprotein with Yx(FWY)xxD motif
MTESGMKSWLVLALGLGSPLLLGTISCESNGGGISLPRAGSSGAKATGGKGGGGSAGSDASGASGEADTGGLGGKQAATGGTGGKGGKGGASSSAGNDSTGGTTSSGGSSGDGGTGGDGGTSGATDGGASGEAGTSPNGGEGNEPGEGGAGGTSGTGTGGTDAGGTGGTDPGSQPSCIFHSDPVAGAGGEGGVPPVANGIAVANNAFLGPYLTDLAGLTLYIYGADVPGDCTQAPVSNCIDDCTQSWPIFDAGERTLASTLDPAVFGTIQRTDGSYQTTFYGWPLYRYKTDTAANMITGQGKGKTWFTAEVSLPNLMIMRGPVSGGGIKYLSDDRGHTLYSLPGDTLGTGDLDPVSSCTGTCLDSFIPFAPGDVYPVTTLEPHDIGLFFREDGTLQTSFKGAPLYYAKSELHAGEQLGLGTLGAALVLP